MSAGAIPYGFFGLDSPFDNQTRQVSLPSRPTQQASPGVQPATKTSPQQKAAPTTMQTIANTTTNFMAPVQKMLNQMQVQDTQQKSINARIAQNQQAQAAAQQAQMGMFLNRATGRQEDMFQAGLGTLRGIANDPQMNEIIRMGFEQAQDPGLSREAIAGMKGQAAATGAANLASSQRQLSQGMAGRGVSGAAREFMRQGLTNRAGSSLSRQMTGIGIESEKFARQREGQLTGQLAGLVGQRQGAGRQFAQAMFNYNPLQQMQQIQQIQSPQQQLGFNLGALY